MFQFLPAGWVDINLKNSKHVTNSKDWEEYIYKKCSKNHLLLIWKNLKHVTNPKDWEGYIYKKVGNRIVPPRDLQERTFSKKHIWSFFFRFFFFDLIPFSQKENLDIFNTIKLIKLTTTKTDHLQKVHFVNLKNLIIC